MRERVNGWRAAIKGLRVSDSLSARLLYKAARAVYKPLQFAVDERFRAVVLLKYRDGAGVHQVSNMTWMNRYPEVFSAAASLVSERSDLRILSYGCSTGEEVMTLRLYFPRATVWGVDISDWNLEQCRRHPHDAHTHFARSDAPDAYADGAFDLIFCMAVLQRPENRDPKTRDSSAIYPFAKFDAKLCELDRHLAVGGLLVVDGADYRFCDASIASRYRPVPGVHGCVANRPQYSPTNQRLDGRHYSERIFQKIR